MPPFSHRWLFWDYTHNYFQLGNYWSEIESHFNNGGKVIIATFDIDGSHSEPTTLWDTLGVLQNADMSTPASVYRWDTAHAIFTTPETVPDFTALVNQYLDDGDRVADTDLSTPIAGFTASSTAAEAGIVVRKDRRAVVNSFLIAENRSDQDADGVLDAVELWENEIQYVIKRRSSLAFGGSPLWLGGIWGQPGDHPYL